MHEDLYFFSFCFERSMVRLYTIVAINRVLASNHGYHNIYCILRLHSLLP